MVIGGSRGKTPWRYLSNGAKMHISSIAITNLSMKTPSRVIFGGQKKRAEVSNPPPLACRSINDTRSCYCNVNYTTKNKKGRRAD